MPPVADEAICIRQWDWSETSQTALLFSLAHGLLRVLAKGSRRSTHPYSGGLETLSRARIGVIVRPHSELALLTEWDLVETFPALRSSLPVHNAGLFIADVIGHAIHDHDPHPPLYDATVESLRLMQAAPDIPAAMLKFLWSVLVETGYRPVLEADVRTGESLPEAVSYRFAPILGGLLADAPAAADAIPPHSWRVRHETIDLLRALDSTGLAASAAAGADPAAVDRAARLLASYLRHVLGTEPQTMSLVFGRRLAR
jgi:DNA repair protein RecO (recombination protein O)